MYLQVMIPCTTSAAVVKDSDEKVNGKVILINSTYGKYI